MREIKILNTSYAESTADFIITNPSGFGNKYDILKVDDIAYGYENNFEDIKFDVTFGVDSNAYSNFNTLMQFMKNNKMVISYNYGTGVRYADVRLKSAPKTEKRTDSTIVSKFVFDRLTPWYEIVTQNAGVRFGNDYPKSVMPVIEFTATSTTPTIEIEKESALYIVIEFDFTGVTLPKNIIIDSENKTIKFDTGGNAYKYVNKSKNTFVELPECSSYSFLYAGTSNESFTYKQWKVD